MNRIKRIEEQMGADNVVKTWLSLPPDNDSYTIKQIEPVTNRDTTQTLTANEYEQFTADETGNVIEVRWEE